MSELIQEQIRTVLVAEAVQALVKALAVDKSGGSYYYTWQANIAQCMLDELLSKGVKADGLQEICNNGAKNFLDLLISTVRYVPLEKR